MTICLSDNLHRVQRNGDRVSESKQSIRVPRSCVVQTPDLLADAMVRALGTRETDTWLEPCVGKGALLSALSNSGVKRNKIIGLDVEARPQPNDRFGKVLRGREFLRWSRATKSRFDKVVANPPYVAIERLDSTIRTAAIEASLSNTVKITANGNAWYAFLCAAIRLLKKDGSLCFLLPAAWDFANYAAPLRATILDYFSSVEIYRTASPIFRAEKVQEGSIILLARGRRDPECAAPRGDTRRVGRHELPSLDELIYALTSSEVNDGRSSGLPKSVSAPSIHIPREHQPLSDILNIRLGVVTGDSSYFLLSEFRRRELKLPLAAVAPVLSRARHLTSPQMTLAQWDYLKEAGERIWLFNPDVRTSAHRQVQSYLRFGRNGGCEIDNHKVMIRSPWFRFPNLVENDGFMSGMCGCMPWLSFRVMPKLLATNTLYVVKFIDQLLKPPERVGVAMSLLSSSVRDQMREQGRSYAAGLLKYEPSDLLSLWVPKIGRAVAGWTTYRRALRALREGNELESRKIADSCIS